MNISGELQKNSRFFAEKWPQLCACYSEISSPYTILSPRQLEDAFAQGDRSLVGLDLVLARLDLALAGLYLELAPDFFQDNFFASRLDAAREVILAALVLIADLSPSPQLERLQTLQEEAEAALQQWNYLLIQAGKDSFLRAAEEGEENLA